MSSLFKVIDYACRVSDGVLNEELSIHSKDEVGILANSLRTMVHNLRAMVVKSEEQQRELERISQNKTDFLANMSHEIRTPLNAISGFSSLFRRDNLDKQQLGYLEKMSVASKAMLQIVNDVLDLSKIEKGKLVIENITFSLQDMLSSINSVIDFMAQSKGCTYSFHIDKDIPRRIVADSTRIQQVLFNLLGNAVKFTSKGGVALKVSLVNHKKNQSHTLMDIFESKTVAEPMELELLFEVEDTGIGISEEQIKQLFQPFTQADASITRQFGGSGLGLTISKKLVELMGGKIEVESTQGKGSAFRFTVKAFEGSFDESLVVNFAPEQLENALKDYNILIVEDNDINQEVIAAMLESLGAIKLSFAANGQEALGLAEDNIFDIIFMDMQMPIMDGVTATKILRKIGLDDVKKVWLKDVPIIALTANALSMDVQKCLDVGMNGHISKPIMLDILRNTLIDILNKKAGEAV